MRPTNIKSCVHVSRICNTVILSLETVSCLETVLRHFLVSWSWLSFLEVVVWSLQQEWVRKKCSVSQLDCWYVFFLNLWTYDVYILYYSQRIANAPLLREFVRYGEHDITTQRSERVVSSKNCISLKTNTTLGERQCTSCISVAVNERYLKRNHRNNRLLQLG